MVAGLVLVFEDDDLFALGIAKVLCDHSGAFHRRRAGHRGAVVAHHEDVAEFDRLGRRWDAVDLKDRARLDPILLSACSDDRVNRIVSLT